MNKRRKKLIAGISTLSLLGAGVAPTIHSIEEFTQEQDTVAIVNETNYVNAKTSNTQMKTTTALNVRSGGSTSYKILTTLAKGTTVTVTSTSNGWSKITYNNGKTGYVNTSYLKEVSSTPNNIENNTNTTTNKSMQTTANLNVRSGGSTSYKILTTLAKGTTVTVTSTSNGWSKITYNNGKTGYVDSRYLKETTSTPNNNQNNTDNSTNTTINKSMQTTENLNVRSGPSTSYSRLTTLVKGTTVTVTSTSNGWSKITYNNGKIGYVDSRYLKETTSTPNNNQNNTNNSTDLNKTMKTTTGLNVRSGPSTSYSRLTTLVKGTTVTVTSISNGWGKIVYGNNKTGYVNISYLEEVKSETTPEVAPEVKPETTPEVTPEVAPEVKPETTPEVAPEVKYKTVKYSTAYNQLMQRDGWAHIEGSPNILGYHGGEVIVSKNVSYGYDNLDLLYAFGFERETCDNNTAIILQVIDIVTDRSVSTNQILHDIVTNSSDFVKEYGDLKLSVIYHSKMISVTIMDK